MEINCPAFASAHWGAEVVETDSGKSLYQYQKDQLFNPASVAKIFTTAAALTFLGPDFRFRTAIQGPTNIQHGLWKGPLVIKGGYDPSFNSKQLLQLARQLVQNGLRRLEGPVIVDEPDPEWLRHAEWEDLTWSYTPELSALSINGNAITLRISPGRLGKRAFVNLEQDIPYCHVINELQTVEHYPGHAFPLHWHAESPLYFSVRRGLTNHFVHIKGMISKNSPSFMEKIAIHQPAEYARLIFIQCLKQAGVQLHLTPELSSMELKEWAYVESDPVQTLLKTLNYESDNLIAETLIRAVGRFHIPKASCFLTAGLQAVARHFQQNGITQDTYQLCDGSGLSRQNLVSPQQVVRTLQSLYHSPYQKIIMNSLPRAGIEGKLKDRFSKKHSNFQIQAKTGTMTHISTIAGFAKAHSGRLVTFCLAVNHCLMKNREEYLDQLLLQILKQY